MERTSKIYAARNPCASDELPIDGEEPSSEQLKSVTAEVCQELGNMDQTPVLHKMPVDTTLEKRGAEDVRISTACESCAAAECLLMFLLYSC